MTQSMMIDRSTQSLTPPLVDTPHSSPSFGPTTPPSELASSSFHARCSRKRIRSVLMRAGTSKGLFFRLEDLPKERKEWGDVILAAMGSPDAYARQLDGMGGGVSTQSKVAVVSRSEDPRADVDYLFIQVPVGGGELDFSGNCGNMSSGVGPFAVDEGLFPVKQVGEIEVTVRIRNVNTNRIIHSTFQVQDGYPVEDGDMLLDGVGASGSPIRLDFIDPSGAMTGKLLPTGNITDIITLPATSSRPSAQSFTVSCIDAANPFIFVDRQELGIRGDETLNEISALTKETLMEIRVIGAIKMGLAKSIEEAKKIMGTPKIALIGQPTKYVTSSGKSLDDEDMDIWVRPFSMGNPHPAIQMTGAVCVAAAASVPGSIVNLLVEASRAKSGRTARDPLVIGHGAGSMMTDGEAVVERDGSINVKRGSVYRTARRLMEGYVLYKGKRSVSSRSSSQDSL